MGQSQLAPRCTGRITVNKAVGEICQTIGLVAEASSYAPAALSGSDSPLTRDGHPEESESREGAGDLMARNLLSPVQCQVLETLPVPALCCRTEPGTLGTSTDAYRLIRERKYIRSVGLSQVLAPACPMIEKIIICALTKH